MKQIYCISGLGADKRAFQYLSIPNYQLHFIEWIVPIKNETIEDYSARLATQIKTENPIIIGMSFGGIIAVEIAKRINTEQVILVSSVKTKFEIPILYRLLAAFGLHHVVPLQYLKYAYKIAFWFFGIKNDKEKKFLKTILIDTNPTLFSWSIKRAVSWQNTILINNLKQINGTADKIFPIKYINADAEINNGGHFMIVNKAAEISRIINEWLNQNSSL
jgi:pimeloyl-ACP methyl ester carboxylesterase